MNKLFLTALLVGGLFLLNSPEAAASDDGLRQYAPRSYDYSHRYDYEPYRRHSYRRDHYSARHARPHHMPHWLQRERSFRRWYQHSPLRRNKYLSWYRLFDFYRWESSRYRHHGH